MPFSSVGITPITTCPHCSKLVDGSCVICEAGDLHPSCEMCVDGQIKVPWYRHELLLSVVTTVVVTVASTIILGAIQTKIKKKKA